MTSDRTPPASEVPGDGAGSVGAGEPRAPRTLPRWRRFLVGFLVVLGCILTPLSILGVWVHNTLLDTDQWVATVGPLVDNPDVQEAVSTRVTNAVIEGTDVGEKIRDLLPDQAKPLAPVVVGGARQVVGEATLRLVESDRFERLWEEVNRRAHDRVVAVLQGEGKETVSTKNGQVVVHLGPIVTEVTQRLSDRGIGLFDDVDTSRLNRDIVIFDSEDLTKAQGLVDLLDQLAFVLPVLTLVVFVGAIALSGNRRRTILRGALGVALAMGILLTAFNLGRSFYLDALPSTVNRGAAEGVYDQVLTFLRTSVRTAFVLAIVVAIAAWLAGAGRGATRIRETVRTAANRERAPGTEPAGAAVFVAHYRNALRIVVVGLGFVVLMVLDHPRPLAVLVVALLVVVGLVLIEFLGRGAPGPDTEHAASV